MGSLVVKGEAICEVTATGYNTFFGKSAELVDKAAAKTQLERVVFNFVKYLLVFGGFLIVVLFALSVLHNQPIADILPILLVMLLPIIPAALPAAFTLSSAIGAKQLAQEGILVTNLSSVEAAASMDTLCVDKTGTITKNSISLEKILSFIKDDAYVKTMAALASSFKNIEDSIEKAIFASISADALKEFSVLEFKPFDPETKYAMSRVKY